MNNSKKWGIAFIVISIILFIVIGGITVVIDPFFHYHAPLSSLEYPINNQRYQNDGIVRHFEYDAIVTGTSMTANFKTTECNKIFGVNAIKVTFDGAHFKEINENLKCALLRNSDIKFIIRGIDCNHLTRDKDSARLETYPTYLTDDFLFNDVNYLLNKEVFLNNTLQVLLYTSEGNETTTFDEYSNWTKNSTFGKESILSEYTRPDKTTKKKYFSEELEKQTFENIQQNLIQIAKQYPNVEFYYFYTPYSIFYWDEINQNGSLERFVNICNFVTELLMEYDNIHVFSFFDEYDMITNADNYRDKYHYHEDINTKILYWIKAGEHELTKENYQAYWEEVYKYYSTYNYDSLFES